MHNVPRHSETHFKVVVVSERFNGLPLVKVSVGCVCVHACMCVCEGNERCVRVCIHVYMFATMYIPWNHHCFFSRDTN